MSEYHKAGVGAPKRDREAEESEQDYVPDDEKEEGGMIEVKTSDAPWHGVSTVYRVYDTAGDTLDITPKALYNAVKIGDKFKLLHTRCAISSRARVFAGTEYNLCAYEEYTYYNSAVVEMKHPTEPGLIHVVLGIKQRLQRVKTESLTFKVQFNDSGVCTVFGKVVMPPLAKKYKPKQGPSDDDDADDDADDDVVFVQPESYKPPRRRHLAKPTVITRKHNAQELQSWVQAQPVPTAHLPPRIHAANVPADALVPWYPQESIRSDVVHAVTDNVWTQRTIAAMVEKYTPHVISGIASSPAAIDELMKREELRTIAIERLMKDPTIISTATEKVMSDPAFQEHIASGAANISALNLAGDMKLIYDMVSQNTKK